jgi:hypothetical protein
MNSKIKNIIILVIVAVVLVLVYIFFIKKDPTDTALLSSSGGITGTDIVLSTEDTSKINNDFLALLLSVKSIKLDDTILKNKAFLSLQDSSIVLSQDGNEGRPNPFAPIGSESMVVPTTESLTPNTTSTVKSNTDINITTVNGSNKN